MVAQKAKAISKHERAGLLLPVALHTKRMRWAKVAKQIGDKATIYQTAIGDYIFNQVLEKAVANLQAENEPKQESLHRLRLKASDLHHAIRNDPDLNEVFKGVSMSSAKDVPKALDKILIGKDLKLRQERKKDTRDKKKNAGANEGMD